MPEPIIVLPGDKSFFRVVYEDQNNSARRASLENAWKHFNRLDPATGKTFYIWYRSTSRKSEVMVDYSLPPSAAYGLYRIETFVPGRYATSRKALFTIANNFREVDGKNTYEDTVRSLDMYNIFDTWVSLGEYLFDPSANPLSGRVRQYILSLEEPAASVSFGPVRWVPLATKPVPMSPTKPGSNKPVPASPPPANTPPTPVPESTNQPSSPRPEGAPRFDAPVGSEDERTGSLGSGRLFAGYGPIWLGNWYDATPFLSWYVFGYHTGADLNLTTNPAADKDAPVYSVADGEVVYAGDAGSWGKIIVIEHPDALVVLPNGKSHRQKVFSRYGHVSSRIKVSKGQTVRRGEHIGYIGLMRGATSGWHLHFDISHSEILRARPAHWPNLNTIKTLKAQGKENTREYYNAQYQVKKEVLANYVDPLKFLKDNH